MKLTNRTAADAVAKLAPRITSAAPADSLSGKQLIFCNFLHRRAEQRLSLPLADRKKTFSNTVIALPDEVLLRIWEMADSPISLARLNKRFRTLSKGVNWRARWLIRKYQPFEIVFEAIARPRLFTAELLRELLRLGAPLAVNVVQLLYMFYNDVTFEKLLGIPQRWGQVSFSAYSEVMTCAVEKVSRVSQTRGVVLSADLLVRSTETPSVSRLKIFTV